LSSFLFTLARSFLLEALGSLASQLRLLQQPMAPPDQAAHDYPGLVARLGKPKEVLPALLEHARSANPQVRP
jgi:hypothetical protein